MSADGDRGRRHHEGTITTAVLTVLFVAGVVWGLCAGWDTGSVATMVTFVVITGTSTIVAVRHSAGESAGPPS